MSPSGQSKARCNLQHLVRSHKVFQSRITQAGGRARHKFLDDPKNRLRTAPLTATACHQVWGSFRPTSGPDSSEVSESFSFPSPHPRMQLPPHRKVDPLAVSLYSYLGLSVILLPTPTLPTLSQLSHTFTPQRCSKSGYNDSLLFIYPSPIFFNHSRARYLLNNAI